MDLKHIECSSGMDANCSTFGFVHCQPKKGTPVGKRTHVIRTLPGPCLSQSIDVMDEMRKLQDNFRRRRQIIGICVKGCKKGVRCDVVLATNAIGTYNFKSLNFPPRDP